MTSVFYVTYRNDAWWFDRSIRSVFKNLKGYSEIVAVAPEQDRDVFEKYTNVRWNFIPDWPGSNYYWQQWVKLEAMRYCANSSKVFHIDSDVMVIRETNIISFENFWPITPYSSLPSDFVWRQPTEKVIGRKVDFEYMRCFPFVVNSEHYDMAIQHVAKHFNKTLEQYIREQSAIPPQNGSFSEFNFLGALAHTFHPHLYNWIDLSRDKLPEIYENVVQLWSHTPIQEAEKQLEEILK
jgi:hypothetical protein